MIKVVKGGMALPKEHTTILSHQAVTHPNTIKGSAQDVSLEQEVSIFCFHASVEAVGNTNPGKFLIQFSGALSGNEDWYTVVSFVPVVSTADTEAMTATEEAGETVLAVASTTGFAAEDILYIQDVGVVVNSEWARCQKIVTNASINLIDGLAVEKDSSDVVWNDANIFMAQLDLTSAGRLRVVFQHEGSTGANCHVKALMITG